MKRKSTLKDLKLDRRDYKNAISVKYNEKRITIIDRKEDGFGFEFRKITDNPEPCATSVTMKGKMKITSFNLSREAAEIMMHILNEYFYYNAKEADNEEL